MKVKLKDILSIKTGKYDANHEDENGDYTFYTCAIKPLKANTYSFDDEVIILPGNGANVGEVLYFNGKLEAYQRTYVLHNIQAEVKYVYYMLKKYWKRHTLRNEVGSATNYIKLGHIQDFEIPLPPLPKQKAIAQKLDLAQQLIDLRKESITKLDALAKSVFVEMFGDPVENEMGWEVVKLKDITDVKTGKTPSRKEPLFWEDGTELWATTTEVNKRYITDTEEKITAYAVEKNNLTVYPKHTILMAMYGQGKTRGKVAELMVESTINQAFCAILPNDKFDVKFLITYLDILYEELRRLGRGGNQENLNLDIVKNLEIMLPPMPLQNKFTQTIQKIEAQKTLYEAELVKLEEGFEGLLAESFA